LLLRHGRRLLHNSDHDYRKHVELIKDYLSTIKSLQVIGRYGSFKYNNQDHSILMGLLAAESYLSSSLSRAMRERIKPFECNFHCQMEKAKEEAITL
jgi:hypothetical protein